MLYTINEFLTNIWASLGPYSKYKFLQLLAMLLTETPILLLLVLDMILLWGSKVIFNLYYPDPMKVLASTIKQMKTERDNLSNQIDTMVATNKLMPSKGLDEVIKTFNFCLGAVDKRIEEMETIYIKSLPHGN